MRTRVLLLVLTAAAPVGADVPMKISIVVSDEKDVPVASRILINRGDRWTPFADTGPDGRLVRVVKCTDGVMFKATPRGRRYYDSEEHFCGPEVKLRVVAKLNPALAHRANPMVGGAAMFPTKNIIDNASNSKDLTTLVAAVKAAGLVDTLTGPGPFTVFAPTNAAFSTLSAGTVETLVKPENKDALTSILTYHVVAGRMTSADIERAIKVGGGQAVLTTVNGGSLTARMLGKQLVLIDAEGGKSTVTIANVMQSNGVVFVIDKVLMP